MEIRAYDKTYLRCAMKNMGDMLDYAVNTLGYTLSDFYNLFLTSNLSALFASGDAKTVAGMSGIELALIVAGNEYAEAESANGKSPEYWTGWVLAYYQWKTGLSFGEIEDMIPIEEIRQMYHPYHEMDITQFSDRLDTCYLAKHRDSRLKQIRKKRDLTQKETAGLSGVPLRTLQQYEQRKKNINKAQAVYVVSLAKTLDCRIEDILEPCEHTTSRSVDTGCPK